MSRENYFRLLISLTAFGLLIFSGCAKIISVDNEIAYDYLDKKILRLVRPTRLSGVVAKMEADGIQPLATDSVMNYKTGQKAFKVAFDSTAGRVDLAEQKIYATDIAGNKRIFDIKQLIWLKFKKQGVGQQYINLELAQLGLEKENSENFADLNFKTEACWEEIVFDKKGGTLDHLNKTITGVSNKGQVISANLEKVRLLTFELEAPSITSTLERNFNKYKWKVIRGSAIVAVAYWLSQGWKDVIQD